MDKHQTNQTIATVEKILVKLEFQADQIPEEGSFYLRLKDQKSQWLLDDYIELAEIGELLLVHPTTQVVALVIMPEEQWFEENIQHEQQSKFYIWIREQLNRVNLVKYTLAQSDDTQQDVKYTVEVLFIVQQKHVQLMQHHIHQLARETQLLHLIGIDIMVKEELDNEEGLDNENHVQQYLCRHMPWLLSHYQQWINESAEHQQQARLTAISATNFRLPDTRNIEFKANKRIHLLHGHNGSGKSTLAESIELWLSGGVERLRGQNPSQYLIYDPMRVVDQQQETTQQSSASLIFSYHEGHQPQPDETQLTSQLIDIDHHFQFSDKGIKKYSFMLDQDFINRLTRGSTKDRLIDFEQAFFADDVKEIKAFHDRQQQVNHLRHAIAWVLGDKDRPLEPLQQDLQQVIESSDREILWKTCSPLSQLQCEQLMNLMPNHQSKQLLTGLDQIHSFTDLHQRLVSLDPLVHDFFKNLPVVAMQRVRKILTDEQLLGGWYVQDQNTGRQYEQMLADWAELSVQVDILTNRLQLAELMEWVNNEGSVQQSYDAQDTGSNVDQDHQIPSDNTMHTNQLAALAVGKEQQLATETIQSLTRKLKEMTSQCDELESQIESQFELGYQQTVEQAPNTELAQSSSVESNRRSITQPDIVSLNKVGEHLLIKGEILLELGGQLAEIVGYGRANQLTNRLAVFKPDWQQSLLTPLEQLIELHSVWQHSHDTWRDSQVERFKSSDWSPVVFSLSARCQLIEQGEQVFKAFAEQKQQLEQNFLQRLQSNSDQNILMDTLNELLRLFTPAPWLYQPLQVIHDTQTQQLTLSLNGKDPGLIWNTAELNLVSVILFLLGANQREHQRPVNTLLMDDPLQNMDEITITYFARGLAKLDALWGKERQHQQLIMLFHGERAVEQFDQQLSAALYHLKWRNGNADNELHKLESNGEHKVKNLVENKGGDNLTPLAFPLAFPFAKYFKKVITSKPIII